MSKVTLDKAGRIVLPKPVREALHLAEGDSLELEASGEKGSSCAQSALKRLSPKSNGIRVYQGESVSDISPTGLIDKEREKRILELIG